MQTLATANQLRQAQGVGADAASEDALHAADLAFDLLERGLADYPPADSRP